MAEVHSQGTENHPGWGRVRRVVRQYHDPRDHGPSSSYRDSGSGGEQVGLEEGIDLPRYSGRSWNPCGLLVGERTRLWISNAGGYH